MFRSRLPILFAAGVAFGCTEPAAAPTAPSAGVAPVASVSQGPVVHRVTVGGPDVCSGFGAQPGCDANFSLVALQHADGSASGRWVDRFSQNFGGGGITVEVDCVAISGSTAWVGGVITQPEEMVGLRAITRARDLGTSANDLPDRFLTVYDPAWFGGTANCLDMPSYPLLAAPQGQVVIE